jgi:hypothetical protein
MLRAMALDAAQIGKALRTIHSGKLSEDEAEAIAELAQMSVDADGQEDAEEIQAFFALGKAVYEMAGLADAPTPTFAAVDDEADRLAAIAGRLTSIGARELAYGVAHLLSIIDIQIQPEEDAFLTSVRRALQVGDDRADDIATQLGEAITPA